MCYDKSSLLVKCALRDYGENCSSIWDGDKNCEHEWNENIQVPRGGYSPDSIVGNNALIKRESVKSNFCSKCNAWKGQLGLEPTFDLFIKHLCDIFDEVKRVLRKDGTCWVNLGDTYGSSGSRSKSEEESEKNKERAKIKGYNVGGWSSDSQGANNRNFIDTTSLGIQEKSLCLIPFRFAIEMQNRGWILRNVIIWQKPNCMPSSVKDRFTVDFEYLFFFVKNKKYWFETQYEPHTQIDRRGDNRVEYKGKCSNSQWGNYLGQGINGRNKRAVWSICPQPFPEAHFATYPEELCETPIKAGCPQYICKKCGKAREKIMEKQQPPEEVFTNTNSPNDGYVSSGAWNGGNKGFGQKLQNWLNEHPDKFIGYTDCGCNIGFESGIVLDPFFGAGTTGLVALKNNRNFIGIELNPEYIKIAKERLRPYLEQQKLPDMDLKPQIPYTVPPQSTNSENQYHSDNLQDSRGESEYPGIQPPVGYSLSSDVQT